MRSRLPAIREARRRVIDDERLGPVIARIIAAYPNDALKLAQAREGDAGA